LRLKSLSWLHKMHWNTLFRDPKNYSLTPEGSLRCRHNLTPVSNICEAVPRSLFWAPCGLNKLLEVRFKLPFNLIGKMTMPFLAGLSWCMLKSWYKVGGPEQGFQSCFTDRHNQSLVSSVAQATPEGTQTSPVEEGAIPTSIPTQTHECLSILSIAVNDFSVLFKFSGEH